MVPIFDCPHTQNAQCPNTPLLHYSITPPFLSPYPSLVGTEACTSAYR
jgi:hypothetical protein